MHFYLLSNTFWALGIFFHVIDFKMCWNSLKRFWVKCVPEIFIWHCIVLAVWTFIYAACRHICQAADFYSFFGLRVNRHYGDGSNYVNYELLLHSSILQKYSSVFVCVLLFKNSWKGACRLVKRFRQTENRLASCYDNPRWQLLGFTLSILGWIGISSSQWARRRNRSSQSTGHSFSWRAFHAPIFTLAINKYSSLMACVTVPQINHQSVYGYLVMVKIPCYIGAQCF